MNKRKMFLRMVLSSIIRRRSRVLIAMLAVAIGATTLSSLAMIAIDVPRQMAREFRNYGANMLVLPQGEAKDFAPATLEGIRARVPADELVGAMGLEYQAVTINDLPYVGVGTDLAAAQRINPYWYVDGDWPTRSGEVLIGREISQATEVKAGDRLTITQMAEGGSKQAGTSAASSDAAPASSSNAATAAPAEPAESGAPAEASATAPAPSAESTSVPAAPPTVAAAPHEEKPLAPEGADASRPEDVRDITVTVTGVLETGGPEDGFVYMEAADMGQLTGDEPHLTVAELSVAASEETLDRLSTQLGNEFTEVKVTPVTRLAHSDANVLEMLRSLMAIITVIVLALITIGVSTTMMAVVTERRTEIGLRKALGADNRSIVKEFIGEAVVLGLVGGLAGAVFGYGLAQLISLNVFHRTVAMQPLVFILTTVVAVVVSTLASLVPVRRAIDVDPALVLRGE
ncbi:MAG: FtsX-like permease family protein [Actinomycetaceae bacterium]|nr:FtsX-like permease family protein [Actinomycetaceae bacterium]